MTDKQPEAMRLANNLLDGDPYNAAPEAAAELRRLHEANQAMLEALKLAGKNAGKPEAVYKITKAAIAKGEQQ